ncbi:MAG: TatD family hydrolase [Rectinemataceae bacterium]
MPAAPLVDAHIHFRDLHEKDPDFPERFATSGMEACAASHGKEEFLWTEGLRSRGLEFSTSLGIHPQAPSMDHADFISEAVRQGRVDFIGEAGFDFFGDCPERVRSPENEAVQREAFEFQLELALANGLPLLIHVRKAMDLIFGYSRRLAALRAALFHSWPGTPAEAEALLGRGIPAYFSFGSIVMNGHKRAVASLAELPADRILSETDAPWQPPRGSPFCRFEDLGHIVASLAQVRGVEPEKLREDILATWKTIRGDRG